MNEHLLEVCVDSVESAIAAEKGGADRIELCSNLIIGGTTPGYELYKSVRESIAIPIHVLIRPRFGDFLYDDAEKKRIMKNEIAEFTAMGADGVVIGMLNSDGALDTVGMNSLIQEVGTHMKITLHRAFDMCKDPYRTTEQACSLGIHTILTSGQKNSCIQGKELIADLIRRYKSSPVSFMAGGGLNRTDQMKELYEAGVRQFHMSGKKTVESKMQYRNPDVSMGLSFASEYSLWKTDSDKVKLMKGYLEQLYDEKEGYDAVTCI